MINMMINMAIAIVAPILGFPVCDDQPKNVRKNSVPKTSVLRFGPGAPPFNEYIMSKALKLHKNVNILMSPN